MKIDRVLVLEPTVHTPEVSRILGDGIRVELGPYSRAELLRAIEGAGAVVARLAHRLDAELFRRAPGLRAIATPTTGLTHIDVEAAARENVEILSLRGEHELLSTLPATAELTWGLLLAVTRKIAAAARHTSEGGWDRDRFRGTELAGKTLGIIGFGRVGRMVAHYGSAFGMRLLACERSDVSPVDNVGFVDEDALLARSDIISLHVSYDQGQAPLIDAAAFAKMKRGAVLLNTSRGELIDETALVAAIADGQLSGAGLDVLRSEPRPHEPLLRMQQTHNVVITPHIGGATDESTQTTELFIARKLRAYIDRVNGGLT